MKTAMTSIAIAAIMAVTVTANAFPAIGPAFVVFGIVGGTKVADDHEEAIASTADLNFKNCYARWKVGGPAFNTTERDCQANEDKIVRIK